MRLSAPHYRLKRLARLLSREENIPLHTALDRIASKEGFDSWSLLAAQTSGCTPARRILAKLTPGDLVLLGARPGHGKTLMGLELIVEAIIQGRRGAFFTLEYTIDDVVNRLAAIGADLTRISDRFEFDDSNAISADHIKDRLAQATPGTVAVVDYLQLLDQKRENPRLTDQIQTLKRLAREAELIIVLISQIDRTFDPSAKPFPDLEDIRLPNPVDLSLFNKTCFLNNGQIQFNQTV